MAQRTGSAVAFLLVLLLGCPTGVAQPPTVEDLQSQIKSLQEELTNQKNDFEARIADLQSRVDTGLQQEIQAKIESIVAEKSKFYKRLEQRDRAFEEKSVFDTVKGGLIFTGLFRSRFEYRANNVDFNPGDGGLDDEGVRFNGRFRLGFGAVMIRGTGDEPTVAALMEFQAVGTFANNTLFNFNGPGGVPLPSEFTLFREPYEQVNLYQGYIDFQRLLGDNLFLKVGRQEMSFGSEFLLGNNAFYDGTVHDAALLEWEPEGFRFSLFYAKETQSDSELAVFIPGSDFDEDEMAGFYAHADVTDDVVAEAYAVYFNARSNFTDSFVTRSTAFSFDGALSPGLLGHFWTLGARLFWTRIDLFGGTLMINAEAAYQTGRNGLGDAGVSFDSQSLHGWSTELVVNYHMFSSDEGLRPILTLAYYYAGGGERNDESANGFPYSHVGFQPMFINRHFNVRDRLTLDQPYFAGGGRYGNMDQIPLSNIHIIKAALTIAPSDVTEVGLAGLMAITADDEGYGAGVFGYELDLFGSYRFKDYIEFAANLSVFLPQKTAEKQANYFFFDGLTAFADNEPSFAFYIQALIEF